MSTMIEKAIKSLEEKQVALLVQILEHEEAIKELRKEIEEADRAVENLTIKL